MFRSTTISISIDRPHLEVYEFLVEPLNLPTWVLAIDGISHREGSDWTAHTPEGDVVFRYQPRNEFCVLDFSRRRPDETEGHLIPLRVVANDDGAEVVFTHYQRPDMSDDAFDSEAEWIRSDLLALKSLLDRPSR